MKRIHFKKILILTLVFMLAIPAFSLPVISAEFTNEIIPKLIPANGTEDMAKAGDVVTVQIDLKDFDVFDNAGLEVYFDNDIFTSGNLWYGNVKSATLGGGGTLYPNMRSIGVLNTAGRNNVENINNGTFYRFDLTVKDTADLGETTVTFEIKPFIKLEYVQDEDGIWGIDSETKLVEAMTITKTIEIVKKLPPVIKPDKLDAATVKQAYTKGQLSLSDPTITPIKWAITEGKETTFNEETGLTFDEVTGLISGVPTTEGSYTFTVTATFDYDDDNDDATPALVDYPVSRTYTLKVNPASGTVTPGTPGGAYTPSTNTPSTNTGSSIAEDAFNGGLTVTGGAKFTQAQLNAAYKIGYLVINGKSTKAADGTPKPVVFTLAVSAITKATNATKNLSSPFEFRFTTTSGAFYLPADITSLIADYKKVTSGQNNVAVRVTITEKKSTRKGELTPVTDFKLELVDGSGKSLKTVSDFSRAIVRTLPLKKDVTAPEYYGIQNRADSTKDWDNNFIPTVKDGNNFKISSRTNSEYVVTEFKNKFTDVEAGKWYEAAVVTSASKGLIKGVTDATFESETALTRAMFVTMIDRVLQLPAAADATREYSDLASVASWGKDPIQRARSAGIIALLTTGTNEFKPDQPITREEMAYVLAKAAEYAKLSETKIELDLSTIFSDASEIGANYANYIKSTVNMKLLEGNADGTFNPKGELTRAQGATALIKLCRALGFID